MASWFAARKDTITWIVVIVGAALAIVDSRIDDKMSVLTAKVDARMDALGARMDALEARMDGLDARMDRLGARMDRLEATLRANHAAVMAELRSHRGKTDSLEIEVAEIRGALAAKGVPLGPPEQMPQWVARWGGAQAPMETWAVEQARGRTERTRDSA